MALVKEVLEGVGLLTVYGLCGGPSCSNWTPTPLVSGHGSAGLIKAPGSEPLHSPREPVEIAPSGIDPSRCGRVLDVLDKAQIVLELVVRPRSGSHMLSDPIHLGSRCTSLPSFRASARRASSDGGTVIRTKYRRHRGPAAHGTSSSFQSHATSDARYAAALLLTRNRKPRRPLTGLVQRQGPRRRCHLESGEQGDRPIENLIDGWKERCERFVWTKTADEIRLPKATARRLQTRDTNWADEVPNHGP